MFSKIALSFISKLITKQYSPELSRNVSRILVMRYGYLGDVLQTTPVLKALHKKWPGAKIDYWVSRTAAPALANNPYISEIIDADIFGPLNIKKPILILRKAFFLRKRKYDLAICLGPDPSYSLLSWIAGVKIRIGLITHKNKSAFLHQSIEVKMSDKNNYQKKVMELLSLVGIESTDYNNRIELFWNENDNKNITTLLKTNESPLIAFSPGGGVNKFRPWAVRKWPQEKWIHLARQFLDKYKNYKIVFFGLEQDASVINSIIKFLPTEHSLNIASQTTFSQLAPLLKQCKILVTHDSSPVFVAAAVNCPTIVLYGPEWPERTRPYSANNWQPVFVDMDCRDYCASFPEKAPNCKNECMSSITVDMVLDKIDYVLSDGMKEQKA